MKKTELYLQLDKCYQQISGKIRKQLYDQNKPMKKITTATPEQWTEIDKISKKWIAKQTEQSSVSDIEKTVASMYTEMGLEIPKVIVTESPFAAIQQAKASGQKDSFSPYWSVWWQSWVGWYEGAEILGVKLDQEALNLLREWSTHCTFVLQFDGLIYVSHRPVKIHWQDNLLHCENGPSVSYSDGWGIYSIEGVQVDEQIVMRPETQTIKQISDEENEEVRRIRIDRFGWSRYLDETSSEVLDQRRNDIEATYEILADCPIGQRLITFCPSTGRRYSLGIPGNRVKSCEEAQQRLWGDRKVYFLGRT